MIIFLKTQETLRKNEYIVKTIIIKIINMQQLDEHNAPAPIPGTPYQQPIDLENNISTENSNADELAERKIEAVSLFSCEKLKVNLVYISVPFIALLHTLPIAIFIIYIHENFNPSTTISLAEKIAEPAVPCIITAIASGWLYWNGIAGRSNGAVDAPIPPYDDNVLSNDSSRVCLALIGNIPNFTTGFLVILGSQVASQRNTATAMIMGVLAGLFNFAVGMLTETIYCFRKHAEYCERQGRPIQTLFNQRLVKYFYAQAFYLEILIDKLYPLINGMVRTQACDQLIASWLTSTDMPQISTNFIRLLCAFIIYSASAFTLIKFDVAQLKESLDNTHRTRMNMTDYFPILNARYNPFRFLDKLRTGRFLYLGLRLCFSLDTSVNIMVGLSAIGLAGLCQRGLCNYVSCDNPAATSAGTNSLLTRYFVGTEAAIKIAPRLTYFMDGLAIGASAAASIVKVSMARKVTRDEELRRHTRVAAMG